MAEEADSPPDFVQEYVQKQDKYRDRQLLLAKINRLKNELQAADREYTLLNRNIAEHEHATRHEYGQQPMKTEKGTTTYYVKQCPFCDYTDMPCTNYSITRSTWDGKPRYSCTFYCPSCTRLMVHNFTDQYAVYSEYKTK